MIVPSDLSPGQFDEVSIFLSKESTRVLAQYQKIYQKIVAVGSSTDDRKVLASAGVEFSRIREQYVRQRRESVTARLEGLMANLL